MASPIRRVLGGKDANALLNARPSRKIAGALAETSSVRAQPFPEKPLLEITKDTLTPQIGQKRKIEQVEDAKDRDDVQNPSQRTEMSLSDVGSELDSYNNSSDLSSFRKSITDTNITSFSASQGMDNIFESQFEFPQDEMSQRTLDKLNAVPLPENTSQLPPVRAQLLKEVSMGSVGMSRFLNLDDHGSSQTSEELQANNEHTEAEEAENPTEGIHTDNEDLRVEEERKQMLSQKADELRTRLQLALFKVQTNQIGCPFSRLKTPGPSRRDLSSSPPSFMQRNQNRTPPKYGSSSTVKNLSSTTRYAVQDLAQHAISPESRISSMRARATAQIKPFVGSLDALPLPRLQPTGFSARWADQSYHSADHEAQHGPIDPNLENMQLPSSPPLSRSPSRSIEDTPAKNAQKTATTEATEAMQLSSPPASDVGADDYNTPQESHLPSAEAPVEPTLTSSPVKGEAANGLLQLMRASSESSGATIAV